MFKFEKKKIGAHTYYVTQLNALVGRKALVRLAKFLGPALASAGKGNVTDALASVAENLSEVDVEYFCDLFAEKTVVTGGKYDEGEPDLHLIFDEHFAGEYLEMVQWLAFAFQVNFASFFAGAARQMAKQKAASNTTSGSETEPTGTSGGS